MSQWYEKQTDLIMVRRRAPIRQGLEASSFRPRNPRESFRVAKPVVDTFGGQLPTEAIAAYVMICALRDTGTQTCILSLAHLRTLLRAGEKRLKAALEDLRAVGLIDFAEADLGEGEVEFALLDPATRETLRERPHGWFYVNFGPLLRILQGDLGKGTVTALGVYSVLSSWAGSDGRCYGKQGSIAAQIGVKLDAVHRAAASLETLGVIQAIPQSAGLKINNAYVLLDVPVRDAMALPNGSELSGREAARRALRLAQRVGRFGLSFEQSKVTKQALS